MQLTFFSSQPYDRRFFEARRAAMPRSPDVAFTFLNAELDLHTVALADGAEAICVFVNDRLDREILTQLSALGVRAVLLRCAGYNQLDLEAADALGLFVARVPAYSPEAVAEHALALTMTLNRRTHRAYNRVREGNFMLDGLLGATLHGKTVGIVGTGRIGMATAAIFHGMGCRVLGFDPAPDDGFDRLGRVVDMARLLAESDIVSLHCPLLDSTHHLIDAEALARMKDGAMLINTSRGALIDTVAVIEALKSRRLGGLAIDVYEQEAPLFFADRSAEFIDDDVFVRLMSFPNVLITGHQGFFTEEAMSEIADTTLANLADFVAGRVCGNRLSSGGCNTQ